VKRRGVTYDTGIVLSGRGYNVPTRPKLDLATAENSLTVVTRNAKDFERAGVQVLNPVGD
jgi:hypothetical protein